MSAETKLDLSGRRARCSCFGRTDIVRQRRANRFGCDRCEGTIEQGGRFCRCEVESSENLAFFRHKPDASFDEFYCGCSGWE